MPVTTGSTSDWYCKVFAWYVLGPASLVHTEGPWFGLQIGMLSVGFRSAVSRTC